MNIQRAKTMTKAELDSLSPAERSEMETVLKKISVAHILNCFFKTCRRDSLEPLKSFAHMNIEAFIQQGNTFPHAIVEEIKNEMCASMVCMALTGNMDRVFSVELSEDGRYSYLTEAGELA